MCSNGGVVSWKSRRGQKLQFTDRRPLQIITTEEIMGGCSKFKFPQARNFPEMGVFFSSKFRILDENVPTKKKISRQFSRQPKM